MENKPYSYLYKNHDINKVDQLDAMNYMPNGGTALLDTLGDAINDLGSYFKGMPEENLPGKVLFVILTDGQENASKFFTKSKIKDMISHQTLKYSWEFIYLGANQDAISEGSSYGILGTNSMNFNTSKDTLYNTMDIMTRSINSYKCSAIGTTYAAAGGITEADRVASVTPGAVPVSNVNISGTVNLTK